MKSAIPSDLLKLLRHEVALITVKTARAGLHPLFHQRFSTGMNKELPGQCNRATRSRDNHCGACIYRTPPVVPPTVSYRHVLDW